MFDKLKVTEALFGLVGFENPTNPEFAIVDEDNTESRSGRFATENPYVKINTLKETYDFIEAGNEDFNEFLKSFQKKSIADVVDKILVEPSYIDRQLLYQFANNKVNTETLPNGFVGYRIQKSLEKNVAFNITRCFLEFLGTGEIELLLFNSAIKEPIYKKTVAITKISQTVNLNWKVDNSDEYFQGDFFFGYLTKDIGILPFKRDYQNANLKSVITHLCFTPIRVNGVEESELFDLSKIENVSECWGLNPDVTVFNDYTDLIIQNEMLFAPAIQLQMVINAIQQYIASDRSNRSERMSQDRLSLLIAQLEGVPGQLTGLIPTLRKDLESLNKQLKRLTDGYFADGFLLNRQS